MNFTCNCHENDIEGNYHILYRLRHNLNDQKSFRPHFCHLYFKTKIEEGVYFSVLYILSSIRCTLVFCPSWGISIDVWDLIRSQRNEKCLGWGVTFIQIFDPVFTLNIFAHSQFNKLMSQSLCDFIYQRNLPSKTEIHKHRKNTFELGQ